jgi:hypothetical protein
MKVIDLKVRNQVDRLFDQINGHRGDVVQNPVTKSSWVKGADPEVPQREVAYRAILARQWFAGVAPEDAPFLPLSYEERERLKVGGLSHLIAWFARSLAVLDFDFESHPSFDDYARGVMASPNTPESIKKDPNLRQRFSPEPLRGLGSGLIWRAQAIPK